MANRFAALLSNTKTRTLVLLVLGVLVVGVVVAVSQTKSGTAETPVGRVSKTTEVPNQVKSTPGEQVSRKYRELQEQANIRGAEDAKKAGTTFIPTLTGNVEGFNDKEFDQQLSNAFDDLGGKCSKDTVAKLRKRGMDTTQIIMELKGYGCSAAAIASLFTSDEIAAALLAAQECNIDDKGCSKELAQELKNRGESATKIAATFKENGCSFADSATALRAVRNKDGSVTFSAADIATALKENGASATEVAAALTKAGFSKLEILPALTEAGFNSLDIAKAMGSIDGGLTAQQRAAEEAAKRLAAQQEAQSLSAFNQQRQAKIQELMAAMETQKTAAMQTWNEIPQQVLVQGDWASNSTGRADGANGVGGTNGTKGANAETEEPKIILKAGSILFATLDTAVNSDEIGPILATIVSGSLKGSKIMGTMSTLSEAEKISLSFTSINMPGEKKSMGISAVAIDPDTARTALASDVDHHYLLRWGSLFASSFVQGYASAVASAGTTQTTSQGAAGTVTNTTTPALTGRQQLFEGVAAVATKWSEVVGRNFDKPNTITIDQGTGIGVLLTSDLEYGTDPVFFSAAPVVPKTSTAQGAALPGATAAQANQLSTEQTAALISSLVQQQPTANNNGSGVTK